MGELPELNRRSRKEKGRKTVPNFGL